jgi:RNA polymerase sigma factor (sigma-70 family)
MTRAGGEAEGPGTGVGLFTTTHWSVVLAAGQQKSPQAAEALERLCRTYWRPLYVYVRRRGYGPEDAQDLTQQFFALFLENERFGLADPDRGKFRTFLLKSVQHFLSDEWKRVHRAKRGGGFVSIPLDSQAAEDGCAVELTEALTPERAYERRWAMTLLEWVLGALREEYVQAGKGPLFEALEDFLWGPDTSISHARIAEKLGMTEGAIRVAVHRLREHYRDRLRTEVAQTVGNPAEVDEELRHLITLMN